MASLIAREREEWRMTTDPWPHLLLDDFLPAAELAAGLDEVAAADYEFGIEPRGTGRIEYSLLKSHVTLASNLFQEDSGSTVGSLLRRGCV